MARHKWSKIKIHNYFCGRCAMLKVNIEPEGGVQSIWQVKYYKPDGTNSIEPRVPPCEPGPLTEARLKRFKTIQEAAP